MKLKGPLTDTKRQQRKEKSVQIHTKEFAPLSRDYNVDEMLGQEPKFKDALDIISENRTSQTLNPPSTKNAITI